jgi:hypothetical protein
MILRAGWRLQRGRSFVIDLKVGEPCVIELIPIDEAAKPLEEAYFGGFELHEVIKYLRKRCDEYV